MWGVCSSVSDFQLGQQAVRVVGASNHESRRGAARRKEGKKITLASSKGPAKIHGSGAQGFGFYTKKDDMPHAGHQNLPLLRSVNRRIIHYLALLSWKFREGRRNRALMPRCQHAASPSQLLLGGWAALFGSAYLGANQDQRSYRKRKRDLFGSIAGGGGEDFR